MADQPETGAVRVTIPGLDEDGNQIDIWSETTFALADEADNPAAITLIKPRPDGSAFEIVLGLTVNVIPAQPTEEPA